MKETASILDHQDDYLVQDNSGLEEINKALKEIEKIETSEPDSENQHEIKEEPDVPEAGPNIEDTPDNIESAQEEEQETKPWKLKRRYFRDKTEQKVLKEENAYLKQQLSESKYLLNESLNSGTYHFSKNAYFELEQAKTNYIKAIEEGDSMALAEANIALTKATNKVDELEKWEQTDQRTKAAPSPAPVNNHYSSPINNNYSNSDNYAKEMHQEIASDWLEGHSYLRPNSPNYNSTLASEVGKFINSLDNELVKHNEQNAYFSEEYFNTIDRYVDSIRNKYTNNGKNLESTNHVGGVRNSYNTSSNTGNKSSSGRITLSPDEKKIAANTGISEEVWLKYKIEEMKKK